MFKKKWSKTPKVDVGDDFEIELVEDWMSSLHKTLVPAVVGLSQPTRKKEAPSR